MKITYDPEVDALYIRFREGQVTSKHVDDDITLDFSEGEMLAGIEVLDASKRFGTKEFIEGLTMRTTGGAITPDGALPTLRTMEKIKKRA